MKAPTMTEQEFRAGFDQLVENLRNAGHVKQAADAELLREYIANPTFRAALEQHIWDLTSTLPDADETPEAAAVHIWHNEEPA